MTALDAAALVTGSRTAPIPMVHVDVDPEVGDEARVTNKEKEKRKNITSQPITILIGCVQGQFEQVKANWFKLVVVAYSSVCCRAVLLSMWRPGTHRQGL